MPTPAPSAQPWFNSQDRTRQKDVNVTPGPRLPLRDKEVAMRFTDFLKTGQPVQTTEGVEAISGLDHRCHSYPCYTDRRVVTHCTSTPVNKLQINTVNRLDIGLYTDALGWRWELPYPKRLNISGQVILSVL